MKKDSKETKTFKVFEEMLKRAGYVGRSKNKCELRIYSEDAATPVRAAVAGNPNAEEEVLHRLFRDLEGASWAVDTNLASNPSLPLELQMIILEHSLLFSELMAVIPNIDDVVLLEGLIDRLTSLRDDKLKTFAILIAYAKERISRLSVEEEQLKMAAD